MDIEREFNRVVAALQAASLDYAVVGGIAVAIWGAPRATTDIDLLVLPTDVDAVLAVVRGLGFEFEASPMSFQDGMRLRRVTKIEGREALTLDLLLADAHLQSEWASRCTVITEAGPVKVVSREALIRMKTAANRPQDLGDVVRLTELDR